MADPESRAFVSTHGTSLLLMFAAIQNLIEQVLRERCELLGVEFQDVWDITAARMVPLQAFLADPVSLHALEEQLVSAGLYGAEMRLRAILFEHLIQGGAHISPKSELLAAGALLRAVDRISDCPAAVGPVADLCDLLAAIETP